MTHLQALFTAVFVQSGGFGWYCKILNYRVLS